MTTFCVVMMALESRSILARVAEHYTRLGATAVTFYIDGPPDETASLAGGPVRVIFCDATFWAERAGTKPLAIDVRQGLVARHALDTHDADWLLFLDADEIVVSDVPFATTLDAIPDDVDVVRLPNHEAVWGPGDTFGAPFGCSYVRRRARRWRAAAILYMLAYGRTDRFLNGGTAGHASGKQLRRIGARYDVLENHSTWRDGKLIGVWAQEIMPDPVPWIAHFDAISVARWTEKFRRRYSGETTAPRVSKRRQSQSDSIRRASARSDAATEKLCRQIYQISRAQAILLGAFGLVWRPPKILLGGDDPTEH